MATISALAPIALAATRSVAAANVDNVAPGLIGFLVVVALGLALWLLLRSMNKHLNKIARSDGSDGGGGGRDVSSPRPPGGTGEAVDRPKEQQPEASETTKERVTG